MKRWINTHSISDILFIKCENKIEFKAQFTSCSLTVPTDPVRRCWEDPGRRIEAELEEEAELSEWEEVWRAASSILREAWWECTWEKLEKHNEVFEFLKVTVTR